MVRNGLRDWILSHEWDEWTVKLEVRDLGGHLDTTCRGWSANLVLDFCLPLDFHGRLLVVRTLCIPGALHGIEASLQAISSLRKLRSSILWVVWTRRQPLANVGAVLGLLDGPQGCDPAYCVVWFRFRIARRYLGYRPSEVGWIYRLLDMVREGVLTMAPSICCLPVPLMLGFSGIRMRLVRLVLGCQSCVIWLGLLSTVIGDS